MRAPRPPGRRRRRSRGRLRRRRLFPSAATPLGWCPSVAPVVAACADTEWFSRHPQGSLGLSSPVWWSWDGPSRWSSSASSWSSSPSSSQSSLSRLPSSSHEQPPCREEAVSSRRSAPVESSRKRLAPPHCAVASIRLWLSSSTRKS